MTRTDLPNFKTLSTDIKKTVMREEFSRKSAFQDRFKADSVDLDCAEFYTAFRGEILRLLLQKQIIKHAVMLEELHEHLPDDMRAYNFNDGVNKVSTFFYDTDEKFIQVYWRFLKELVQDKIFGQPFWFQATPTIRIHCPKAQNSDHYPRYHTDIGYGHPPQEVNFWMPLTEVRTGHGFRRCNVENSCKILDAFDYDFEPFIDKAIHDKPFSAYCNNLSENVLTPTGKVHLFDSRCIHTGEPLKEHTRISMDIRIITLEDYEKLNFQYQGSGRRQILFSPGHCYYSVPSNQLKI